MIRPLHNQILIRPILEDKFSPDSQLVMPDSAKRSTLQSADGKDRVNFVLAEVVAVGPGRPRVDSDLVPALVAALQMWSLAGFPSAAQFVFKQQHTEELLKRAYDSAELIPLDVKPGDRILYHPSVRNFDRSVDIGGVEHFIIGEHSLLAIVGENVLAENLRSHAQAGATLRESGE